VNGFSINEGRGDLVMNNIITDDIIEALLDSKCDTLIICNCIKMEKIREELVTRLINKLVEEKYESTSLDNKFFLKHISNLNQFGEYIKLFGRRDNNKYIRLILNKLELVEEITEIIKEIVVNYKRYYKNIDRLNREQTILSDMIRIVKDKSKYITEEFLLELLSIGMSWYDFVSIIDLYYELDMGRIIQVMKKNNIRDWDGNIFIDYIVNIINKKKNYIDFDQVEIKHKIYYNWLKSHINLKMDRGKMVFMLCLSYRYKYTWEERLEIVRNMIEYSVQNQGPDRYINYFYEKMLEN
jgi:hypothetical protein